MQERYAALSDEVARLLARGQGFAAKLAIELDLLTTGSASAQPLADRAHHTLEVLLDTLAVDALLEKPDLRLRPLVEWMVGELDRSGVRARVGGDNRTLIEVFASRRLHPPNAGAERSGTAYWVDCDTATLTVFAVLDRLDDLQPERRLWERLRIVSYADHMALALLPVRPGEPTLVGDMNSAASGPRRQVEIEWHERGRYEELFRQRTGESMVMLRGWEEVLANTWDVGAARLIGRKEYDRARLWAERAVALNSRGAGGHNSLALALRRLDRPEEALAALEVAVELRPRGGRLYSNLASLLLELGDLEAAADAADSAVELMPELASARLSRREIRTRLGDSDGARADLEVYLELAARRQRRGTLLAQAQAPTAPP